MRQQRFLCGPDVGRMPESLTGNTQPDTTSPHTHTHTQPDRIIGSTDRHGELTFLIKWRESEEVSLMSAREASERNPQMVIAFYEERLHCATEED
ncbi:hypothetical protein ACEWY4_019342 [Coilia grayii]|uniref:Chromo domain-containing protein n=1 Tax=Coilia grayii TaxID=363190 RepID=A0ABD1J9G6_9TELE